MSLLRAIARDFWRKSYVKCHFCVSPRRWKLAPRIMPLSYPGYSVTHDDLKYSSVFAINDFFIKYYVRKAGGIFPGFFIFNAAFLQCFLGCAPRNQGSWSKSAIWRFPKLIHARKQRISRISGYFSRREWKCTVVNVLIVNWEIIVSASPQPCPSTSRSNFQRETAALLQARSANSFVACVAADAK